MIKLQVRKSGVSDGRAWFTVGSWPAELFASVVAPLYPCGTVGDFVSLIKADGTPVPTAPAAGTIEVAEIRTRAYHTREGEGKDAIWSTTPTFRFEAVLPD